MRIFCGTVRCLVTHACCHYIMVACRRQYTTGIYIFDASLHTATKNLVAFGPPMLQNCFVMSDRMCSSEPGSRPKGYCHSIVLMFTKFVIKNCFAVSCRISAETDRLTITNIQPEDEGLYACVAREGDDVQRTVIAGCIIVHGKKMCMSGVSTTR